MIAAFLRFALLGVIVAVAAGSVLYVCLRWVIPFFWRGQIEENKAYKKLCKELKVKPPKPPGGRE